MPEDERNALVRRHGNKEGGEAYTAHLNNRVASEIELRDPS